MRHWFENNGERTGAVDRRRAADRRQLGPLSGHCGAMPCRATHIAVSRYADPLPLYRQSRIHARGGVDPLAGWACLQARESRPFNAGDMVWQSQLPSCTRSRSDADPSQAINSALHTLSAACFACACRVTDETRAPVPDPGAGKTKTGSLWSLTRDDRGWGGDDPPAVVFTYARPSRRMLAFACQATGRSGTCAMNILRGFEGILQIP